MNPTCLRLLPAVVAASWVAASAQVLRVGSQGDAMSMDPHTHNESLQLGLLGNVYEPLVGRAADLRLVPALALSWNRIAPRVWRFELRPGVRFHDGTPFGPDDVVFSLRRAMRSPEFGIYVGDIRDVRIAGPDAVDVETRSISSTLPDSLTVVYMMSRRWSESVQAVQPADRLRGAENAASFSANGTGPFQLRERQPDVRTTLARNRDHWGAVGGNVQEVRFLPMRDASARVAALLAGDLDVVDAVPLQDIAAVDASRRATVHVFPESRILFLGMDVGSDRLQDAPNPLKDRRVRQALYQAIDVDTLVRKVMHGAATPTALMVAPGVRGYAQSDDRRLPFDPPAARALLAEAGFGRGFDLPMHCPNDRYVNDAALCEAISAQLARVGVRVRLELETKSRYFPKVLGRRSPFFLLGWAPATYDALNVLQAVMACQDGKAMGYFNAGGYCNPEVDRLVLDAQQEPDAARRDLALRRALQMHAADIGHIPLHRQSLAWGVRTGVHLAPRADGMMQFNGASVAKGDS